MVPGVTSNVTTPPSSIENKILFLLVNKTKPPEIAKLLKVNRMFVFRTIQNLQKAGKIIIQKVNKRTFNYSFPLVTSNSGSMSPVTTPLKFRFENVRVKFPLLDLGSFTGTEASFRKIINLKYDRFIEKYGNELLIEINNGKNNKSLVVVFRNAEWKEEPLQARQEFLTRATQAVTDFANKWNIKWSPNPKFLGKVVNSEGAIETPSAPAICEQVRFYQNELGKFDKSNGPGEQEYNPVKETGFDAFQLADKHLRMPLKLEELERKQELILQSQKVNLEFSENIRTHLAIMQDIQKGISKWNESIDEFKKELKEKKENAKM